MSTRHRGVGAVVTTAHRTLFFVQQKDARYPDYPLGYSFFGGAIDAHEEIGEALARELREELGAPASALIAAGPRHLLTTTIHPERAPQSGGFEFSLFEICIDQPTLEALALTPVLEGERGVLVDRGQLRALPFIWGLETVAFTYLDTLH